MRMAYLGMLSTVFNWVFNRLLAPFIKFLSVILSAIFEWIFNWILQPLLIGVFKYLLPWVIELFVDLISGILYSIMTTACEILDYLQEIFYIFGGAQNVIVKGATEADNRAMPLLDALFLRPEINRMFIILASVGFGLAFIFAIIAVVKSTIDLDFEGKRPVSAVLRSLFKSILSFLLINLGVLFVLNVSGVVLNAINQSTSANDTSLGRIVFCVATLNASKNPKENIDEIDASKNIIDDTNRKLFYYKNIENAKDYRDSDDVEDYFHIYDFDFFTAIVVMVFLLVVLASTAIVFVQRIFEILILYLVSPFFVATMPLDDGEKFKKWKEMFIAKVFGGYGSVLAMNLFLILVPIIMGNSIDWGQKSAEGTFIFKLLFLCGGAYAITKIGPMITTLLNWQAGQAESATSGMVGGAIGGAAVSFAMKGAHAALSGTAGALASPFRKNPERTKLADQKFKAMQKAGAKEGDDKIDPKDYQGADAENDAKDDNDFYGLDPKGSGDEKGDGGAKGAGGAKDASGDNKKDAKGEGASTNGESSDNKNDQLGGSEDKGADGKGESQSDESNGLQNESGEASGEESNENAQLDNQGNESADGEQQGGEEAQQGESQEDKQEGLENKDGLENQGDNKEGAQDNAADIKDKDGQAKDDKQGADKAAADKKAEAGDTRWAVSKKFDKLMNFAHRVLPLKRAKDGSYSVGLLGFRVNYDKNGERVGVKFPFVSCKGKNGSYKVDSWNIPGIIKFSRVGAGNGKDGEFKLSSIPLFGVKRYEDKNGKMQTSSAFGFQQQKGKDGKMHFTSGPFGLFKRSAAPDGTFHMDGLMGMKIGRKYNNVTGQYETNGVRIGNMIFGGVDPYSKSTPKEASMGIQGAGDKASEGNKSTAKDTDKKK